MSSKSAVRVIGLSRLQARMRQYNPRVAAAVSKAVNDTAKDVFSESQRRVPVDTGNLKGSARITPSTPRELAAMIAYGGTAAAYALIVHETHATKSKYLEAPAREAANAFRSNVRDAIRGVKP